MAKDKEGGRMRNKVGDFIPTITKAEDISKLFSVLEYPEEYIHKKPLQRNKAHFDFHKDDAEKINNIYSPLSFGDDVPVFLLETTSLTPSFIRSATNTLDHQYLRFMVIFTIDYSEIVFVYPKKVRDEKGKQKLKITKLVLNKDDLHYTQIQTLARINFPNEANWRVVWRLWGEAFNVESVTKQFFEDYKRVFFNLRESIASEKISTKEAHEFSLQFLNRVMFIYFIAKKGWLKHSQFIKWQWEEYKSGNNFGSDAFYRDWLSQVFFKAFNNRSNEITGLPDHVTRILLTTPYLNGGLFAEKEIDAVGITISDEMFKEVLAFFETYNFTIREDMPLEEEVAVDPQMIGYVYESLANVAEEIYDRNDLGIFYTPRIEVDFMCRRALVGSLINQLPDVPKEALYHFVFDPPEDKAKVSHFDNHPEIWSRLERILNDLSIVDPACGSGAFLVGMLSILTELYQFVYAHTAPGLKPSVFDTKYSIIQRSLYGVDVMPWAVRAAELRLWLQLVVDTELSIEDVRKGPLLPNLTLKLRVGDSMVQELGGVSFNIRTKGLDDAIRKDLEKLKQEKDRYYEGARTARYRAAKEFCRAETIIFLKIIDSMVKRLEKAISKSEDLTKDSTKQTDLSGSPVKKEYQTLFKVDKSRKITDAEILRMKDEIHHLKSVKSVLDDPEKKPFIWDIDFAEIFGEKNGFDVVIGNPPYVRQEIISPPNRIKADVTQEERRDYKEKLIRSVMSQFPVIRKINKQSDLYTYFYFHGLSLLNEMGVFCFITSNSWLDVDYGKDLQEFLLEYVPIHAIYDNPKRSFEHADVNTIIAVFGAPAHREESFEEKIQSGEYAPWTKLTNTAKFVMFKKSFEEVISSETMIAIDHAQAKIKGAELIDLVENIVQTDAYQIFPVLQEDLLEDGWKYPDDYEHGKSRFKHGAYEGNKWGGKYLRAPNIFYTILKKGKGKLVHLGDIAKVSRGFTTGANDFFYLDEMAQRKWQIEPEFLKSVIKSPKEVEGLIINPRDLNFKVIICDKQKTQLKGTNLLKYIESGENQIIEIKRGGDKGSKIRGYQNLETIKNRRLWYNLPKLPSADILFRQFFNEIFNYPINPDNYLTDHTFYFVTLKDRGDIFRFGFVLNSTITWLFTELQGRKNMGEGVLTTYGPEMRPLIVFSPMKISEKHIELFKQLSHRSVKNVYEECGFDPTRPIRDQEPQPLPDRAELDNIIFDELKLTDDERKDVYWSVCELVKQRLDKAKSIKGEK